MKYLFDASALYSIFEVGKLPLVSDIAVLTLTEYEVGNAIWKNSKKGKIESEINIIDAFIEFFNSVNVISIDFRKVQKLAFDRDLTFYDASYVSVAEEKSLALITEDKEILRKSKAAVSVDKFKGDYKSY